MALFIRYIPSGVSGGGGSSITTGDLTDVGTDGIVITGGTNAVVGSGTSIAQHVADSTHNGYLSSLDWTTFNSKQVAGNYITALTGDATASGPGSAALTFATVNSNVGSFGSASSVGGFTVNAKGLITAASSTAIQITESQVTDLVSDLAGKQPTGNYITALTGDATASGPGSAALTLATVNAGVGSFGSASSVSAITVNAKGLVTAAASTSIQIAESQVTNLVSDLAGKQPTGNYITALTGDVTAAGPGSSATTLATVNANVGSFGSASASPSVTVNAKGLVTAASSNSIQIAESQVTNLVSDLAGKQATGNYITALTGDATASGPGSAALTFATVNTNVGSFGSASSVGSFTVNGKGLVTAASSTSIQIAESQVTNLVSDLAGKQATGNYITALSGDVVAAGPGSASSTIQSNVVSNAKLAQMPTLTIKGNNTGGTANASDLTVAQVNAILPVFTSTLNGLVPLSGGGSTNYLRADGTWAAPPGTGGSGTVTSVALTVPGFLSVAGSPITTSGTLAVSLATQSAGTVFAGPTNGAAAAPTFRALAGGDFGTGATSPSDLLNVGLSVTASAGSITIAVTQADGSTNATSASPGVINFRDGTSASNGNYSLVQLTGSISKILSTTDTLGSASGVASTVYVYLINNGGSLLLGASLNFYDEATLQSTSTSGTSNSVIYSSSAVSNKAVRLVGRFKATNTASSWGSPSEVSPRMPMPPATVAMRYGSTSTATLTTGAFTTFSFATRQYDTHFAYNTGTGVYTAPVAGKYMISATLNGAGTLGTTQQFVAMARQITGGASSTNKIWGNGANNGWYTTVTTVFSCAAGDTMDFQYFATSGVTLIPNGTVADAYITINRIGD